MRRPPWYLPRSWNPDLRDLRTESLSYEDLAAWLSLPRRAELGTIRALAAAGRTRRFAASGSLVTAAVIS